MGKLWQITLASDERYRWFHDEARRLAATRAMVRAGGAEQVLFCIVDEHAHSVVHAERKRAGRIAANLSNALSRHVDAPLQPSRLTPVNGRRHLETLVGYITRQTVHHGIDVHPVSWPSSCLADLVGARHLDGFDPDGIFQLLPRWDREQVWRAVGIAPPAMPTDPELSELPVRALYKAAAATRGVAIGHGGHTGSDTRAMAARLAASVGHSRRAIQRGLGVGETTARRLLERPLPDHALAMVRRQLALRNADPTKRAW